MIRALTAEGRPATSQEQGILARWSAWGAVPGIFDEQQAAWSPQRDHLRSLLSAEEYTAARRTTINAHYTDPSYVRAIWKVIADLGFTSGRVLEPGCGAGTFIGLAPAAAEVMGVELDPVTASIATALYPRAAIRAESFAATRLPEGFFDLAVGNVPYADVHLHDSVHNRGHHSLHNHFLIKSLHLTRPGGLVVALTSRFTLDAQNPAARREMREMADLVGAVRLPTGAHRRAAGTDALTDLVILRRRLPDERPGDDTWTRVVTTLVDGQPAQINAYLDQNPHLVLGEYHLGHGMYGENTLSVTSQDLGGVAQSLEVALGAIAQKASDQGLTLTPRALEAELPQAHQGRVALADEGLWEGHLTWDGDKFTTLSAGIHTPTKVPATHAAELRALLALRDSARQVLTTEASTIDDTSELDELRTTLDTRYRSYVALYGPLNRRTTRSTGRYDAETGEAVLARVTPPALRILRTDPFYALVLALEDYDETSGIAVPAAIVSRRVVQPREPVRGVDTAADALAVSLDTLGRADLPTMASLLGLDEAATRAALGTLVFDDPDDPGAIIPAPEYLSGNAYTKLDRAREAAQERPELLVNVRALQAVIPRPLGIDEIQPRLGAAWIDQEIHQAFVADILNDRRARVLHLGAAKWEVTAVAHGVAATSEWGTRRVPAPTIIEACLSQRIITVYDDLGDGKRVMNPLETEAAREKATALQERFAEWLWEDAGRASALQSRYNRQFNGLVLRDYTAEGDRLTLPGLASTFTPRPHQRAAVARMIAEPSVGLFHEVGAGKTAEMAMGVMELRRLGMINKAAVVVPNHMLEQFSREWLQIYPQARLLAAGAEDLAGDKRRHFVARAAANDWDAVIMTRTAFERLPVSPRAVGDYFAVELEAMRTQLERATALKSRTVKQLEKRVQAFEEKMRKLLDTPVDPGVTFEETGLDYLVIDEMHDYKNLQTISAIPDAAIDGSQRAQDLHLKTELLRRTHGNRVITGATATPIANSITEAHVMQRFMRPDLLREAGVEDFDAWAATFGQVVTEIEMSVTGGYRQKSRFARFQNVPEMLRMWHTFADVKTAEDLDLPRPALKQQADGTRGPRTMVLPPSEELTSYVQWLGRRADAVASRRVDTTADNMLKITTDGRKAALDMRLATGEWVIDNKVEAAAAKIAEIWRASQDLAYLDPTTKEQSPVLGALQLVFCDLSTPAEHWNVYAELRRQLVHRGMPPEAVRFIHEAKNNEQKAELFAAARAGHIAVLVGSTQKMGVGTNVQARAITLHHLDCPWRPADLEQREGRIIRQGNQNPEVEIFRWVVEGSFDAYSWQTVARKARFISQVMRGRLDVREIEDIGDQALSFAEVKALASGDPMLMERERARQDITRLERLERAWHRNLAQLVQDKNDAQRTHDRAAARLPIVRETIARTTDISGDAFSATIEHNRVSTRTDAAAALASWATRNAQLPTSRFSSAEPTLGPVATLAGHTITAAVAPRLLGGDGAPAFVFTVDDLEESEIRMSLAEITAPESVGAIRRLENTISRLPSVATSLALDLERAALTITQAQAAAEGTFKHADALAAARTRLAQIDQTMNDSAQEASQAAYDVVTAQPTAAATPSIPERIDTLTKSIAITPVSPTGRIEAPGRRGPTI